MLAQPPGQAVVTPGLSVWPLLPPCAAATNMRQATDQELF